MDVCMCIYVSHVYAFKKILSLVDENISLGRIFLIVSATSFFYTFCEMQVPLDSGISLDTWSPTEGLLHLIQACNATVYNSCVPQAFISEDRRRHCWALNAVSYPRGPLLVRVYSWGKASVSISWMNTFIFTKLLTLLYMYDWYAYGGT